VPLRLRFTSRLRTCRLCGRCFTIGQVSS
jgi:hypothetical protein